MTAAETTKLKGLLDRAYELLTVQTTDPETALELAAAAVSKCRKLVSPPSAIKYTACEDVVHAFWDEYPEMASENLPGRRHADFPQDVQDSFDDFVDELCRAEEISEAMAGVLTLG